MIQRPADAVRLTHPDRVIDTTTGVTRRDLVSYYLLAAKRMLPHLVHRPVALVRAPAGIQGQLFFQKHAQALTIPDLTVLDPAIDPGHPPLMALESFTALIGAVQMNVVEFHTWNATTKNIDKPDRMTFDLDPGDGVQWSTMQEAAQLTRGLLDELGLASFLKTSGGKGLHVVVPLTPRDDWDTVKDFSQAVVQHLARVVPAPRCAHDRASGCRFRSRGTSCPGSRAARTGPSATRTSGSNPGTTRGPLTRRHGRTSARQ